jgi:Arc/MetJ family transcription regulator
MRRVGVDVDEALLRRVMGRYGFDNEGEAVEMA